MDDEKGKVDGQAEAARLIYQAVRALEDGAISPLEGVYLCKAGAELLDRLRPKAKRWIGKAAIDTAQMVLRQLGSDLQEMADNDE